MIAKIRDFLCWITWHHIPQDPYVFFDDRGELWIVCEHCGKAIVA